MKPTLILAALYGAAVAVPTAHAQGGGPTAVTVFPFESGSGRAQEGRAEQVTKLMSEALSRHNDLRVTMQAPAVRGRPTATSSGTRYTVMGAIVVFRGSIRIDARLIDVQQSAIVVRETVSVPESEFVASPGAAIATLADKIRAGIPRQQTGSDSTAVITAVTAFHDALAAGDSTAALRLLADDAVILENDSVFVRDTWRSARLPTAVRYARAVRVNRTIQSVTTGESAAWIATTIEATGTYREQPVNAVGTELFVLSRDGEIWRIRALHATSHERTPSPRPATVPQ